MTDCRHADPDNSGQCIYCGVDLETASRLPYVGRPEAREDVPPARATTRRTYRVVVSASIVVDDETLSEVQRILQEQVNIFYHRLERDDDIRVLHQQYLSVTETS